MARRHALMIALLGWVLLSPPMLSVNKPYKPFVDLKAPLWQWKIEKTFDSASQCEREKRKRQRDSRESEERDLSLGARNDAQLDHETIATYEATAQMKCTSMNDPGLKRR